ncbi:MAG: polysaccharide deacetylase family protein [Planctomycetota bacterium]
MTLYIAAYDVESPACLPACRKLVELHRRTEVPATFFVVGRRLEEQGEAYGELLDDPLFEVASHTYSHATLRDHPFCGSAVGREAARREFELGKEWVERVFERPCFGVRPACSFPDGLSGAPDLLGMMDGAGFRYASSAAWGPDHSLPAPLRDPFRYGEDGFPHLWELPCHGWHENLLKNHNRLGPARLTLWPPPFPEAVPPDFLSTPEEEFAVHRLFVERAAERDFAHVSLIWHPWSLDRFDPEMRMPEMVFRRVRDLGLQMGTYADLFAEVSEGD